MNVSRWIALGIVLIVAAALYAGAWFVAAGEAGRRLDGWQTNEAALGRRWTCPDRKIAGFPFAITVDCTNASFAAQGRGNGDTAKVAHVSATVSIVRPNSLAIKLRPPLSYATSDGATSVSTRWTTLELDVAPLADPHTIDVAGTDLSFEGRIASDRQSGRLATLAAHLAMPDGAVDSTLNFALAIGGTNLAPLDELFGTVDNASIDLTGHIERAGTGAASTLEDIIEAWRRAGGRIDLTASQLSRGSAAVSAVGVIALDSAHRPQGHLDAEFVGVGPVLQRYGINPGLIAAGSLLSRLLGGGQRRPSKQPNAISLPIDLHDGRLGIGPITTSVALPALY